MSAFREDINDMGVETRSLVSSPLLLADIEDPRNTTFVVAGVERDTLSFPQFDEDGFITIATEDGYSPSEVDAIATSVTAPASDAADDEVKWSFHFIFNFNFYCICWCMFPHYSYTFCFIS